MSNIIFTQCFVSGTLIPMLIEWKTWPGSRESTLTSELPTGPQTEDEKHQVIPS